PRLHASRYQIAHYSPDRSFNEWNWLFHCTRWGNTFDPLRSLDRLDLVAEAPGSGPQGVLGVDAEPTGELAEAEQVIAEGCFDVRLLAGVRHEHADQR